jgi:hypothetical protein
MVQGAKFPPIVVYFDGGRYWLADGFHRLYATDAAGLSHVLADVREGGRRDALLHSVSANAEHGHRRTPDDKRRAIDIMLNDPQWARWGDDKIAAQIGVHRTTVLRRREQLSSALHKIADARRPSGSRSWRSWRDRAGAELVGGSVMAP